MKFFTFDLFLVIDPQIAAAFPQDLCRSTKSSRSNRRWAVHHVLWNCYIFQVILYLHMRGFLTFSLAPKPHVNCASVQAH